VRNLILRAPLRVLVWPGELWPRQPNYPLPPAPVTPTTPTNAAGIISALNLTSTTLGGNRVLAIDPATGGWVYADCTNPDHADAVLGVSLAAISPGAQGDAVNQGEIVEPSWSWTIGQTLWVGTNGMLSRYVDLPANRLFDREIASAKAPTKLVVDDEPALMKG
jgi:hypothetical protein